MEAPLLQSTSTRRAGVRSSRTWWCLSMRIEASALVRMCLRETVKEVSESLLRGEIEPAEVVDGELFVFERHVEDFLQPDDDFEDLLSGNYRTWEYCVQYRETDFNFISRLMEQEGIYYYFKNKKDIHTLVMSDSIGSHDPIPGYEEIPYVPFADHSRAESEHIFEWFTSQAVQPGSYVINDYNFKTPKANLEAKLSQQYEHEHKS